MPGQTRKRYTAIDFSKTLSGKMTKSKQIQEGMRNQTSSEPTAAADFATGPTSVASRKATPVLRAYQQCATSTSQEHSISSLHVKKVSNLSPQSRWACVVRHVPQDLDGSI